MQKSPAQATCNTNSALVNSRSLLRCEAACLVRILCGMNQYSLQRDTSDNKPCALERQSCLMTADDQCRLPSHSRRCLRCPHCHYYGGERVGSLANDFVTIEWPEIAVLYSACISMKRHTSLSNVRASSLPLRL